MSCLHASVSQLQTHWTVWLNVNKFIFVSSDRRIFDQHSSSFFSSSLTKFVAWLFLLTLKNLMSTDTHAVHRLTSGDQQFMQSPQLRHPTWLTSVNEPSTISQRYFYQFSKRFLNISKGNSKFNVLKKTLCFYLKINWATNCTKMPDAAKKDFFHLMWKIFIFQKVRKNTPAYKKISFYLWFRL